MPDRTEPDDEPRARAGAVDVFGPPTRSVLPADAGREETSVTADTLSIPVRPTRPSRGARPSRGTRPVRPTRSHRARDRVGRTTEAGRASRPLLTDAETAPVWMRSVGGLVLAAGLALSAAVLAWPGDAPEAGLIVTGLAAVVVGLLLVLARAGLTVTEAEVVLHFRPLPPRRLARRRITRARVVEADATTYGGVGLRLARRRRALILTPGAGVELTDDRGRVTFVRTRCATEAIRVIAARDGSQAAAGAVREAPLEG